MKAHTVLILVVVMIYFGISAVGNYTENNRVISSLKEEITKNRAIESEGRCYKLVSPGG